MAELARQTLATTSGEILTQTIEQWAASRAVFDLALSRLALHYVADLAPIFANAAVRASPARIARRRLATHRMQTTPAMAAMAPPGPDLIAPEAFGSRSAW